MKFRNELYILFAGVNDSNQDIVVEGTENILVDMGQKCPPYCNEDSPLIK